MASSISKSIINKNDKLNINFIRASGGSCTRNIFNINTSIIKNEPILT